MYKCNYQIMSSVQNEYINVNSGDSIELEITNAYGDDFKSEDELLELLKGKHSRIHHHPLTGPIYVNNSKKGNIIKMDINDIRVKNAGITLSKSGGIIPLVEATNESRSPVVGNLDLYNNEVWYKDVCLKLSPMIGIASVADLKTNLKTGHAKQGYGGNLDIPFVTIGNSVYLPIKEDGTYLYLGDTHAKQGYGELGGIAFESSSKVSITLTDLKNDKEINNIIIWGKDPIFNCEGVGVIGIGDISDIYSSYVDAFLGTIDLVKRMTDKYNEYEIKEILSLIGNMVSGQGFAKTSESTAMCFIKKEDLEKVIGYKINQGVFEELLLNEKNNKVRCM